MCRFICILLIVIFHSCKFLNVPETLSTESINVYSLIKSTVRTIASSAVPTFFFISSILLYRRPFTAETNIKKKIKTILIPLLLINAIWILLFFIGQKTTQFSFVFNNEKNIITSWNISQWFDSFFGFFSGFPLVYPLWFLRQLFILNIVAVPIWFLVSRFPITCIIASSLVWFFLDVPGGIPVQMKKSFCFWIFGAFLVKKQISLSALDKKMHFFLFAYVIILFFNAYLKNFKNCQILENVAVIGGIFAIYISTKIIIHFHFSEKILILSNFSMGIYLFHEMTLTFFHKFLLKILPEIKDMFWTNLLVLPTMICALCICFCLLLKKAAPRLYSVITGGR